MERAQAEQVGATLAQRDMAPDDIDDVGAGQDFLDEGIGNLTACRHACESSVGRLVMTQ